MGSLNFYVDPAFYLILAVAVVPASILGLTGHRIKYYGLAASVVFLLLLFGETPEGIAAFVTFLCISCTVTFWVLRSWQRGQQSMLRYRLGIAFVVLPLVVYKVGAVFDQNLMGFLGISYVTFKAVQVIIEIRDGVIAEMTFVDYLYFLVFFAPFTSGPIDRSRRFTDDANRIYSTGEYANLLASGIMLILIGAVYQKVLGTVFFSYFTPEPLGGGSVWHEALAQVKDAYMYGFYLFFDFAGYSMMAMGASYCFGIKTPRNFRAPFLALDVREFWDRWHMTLSAWLRDFVFMRVVKHATRKKLFADRMQRACAGYMCNFMLMGAWHGITVDYLAYGLYYGVLMSATDVYQKKSAFHKRHRQKRWYKVLQWVTTINLVMFGMAIFSGQLHMVIGGIIHG
ncbi:D-alanyl-lipoteichoic acid biosynthesis protein DltB [Parvibacter caecicola]|uniref:Membrane protein involved in D-alanine export n=1 Tax=Parvibacter caecicola TaxID=747645 RepID=A0A7W5D300_9ACTN|nr:D-alanyl-lipoteichoic acid biosynthesis protein DltB [Parvibacter caecicola]MBB3171220.1 membrane protein involved in D-alanine export [Parvibacter caecicola]MCR2041989.1 D-alanyl-lipoteichoic acid biosynthesis protein DltB [Parvibacter caecicola]RNL09824.1 D-alanyl-lipoteichoic acid biosynthesis protein DltB [Parvibacter caecicola]